MILAVQAGLLSGSTGIESIPGPQLPQIDFLNKFNGLNFSLLEIQYVLTLLAQEIIVSFVFLFSEENQKKYAEFDERFKSSPLLQKLLEQSKLNKEKYNNFPIH